MTNAGKTSINYTVNNDQYSMKPDYQQTLPAGQDWSVRFDRGGQLGEQEYSLSEGTYAFTPTETGWDLFEDTFTVTIDNTHNPFVFNYVIENKQQTLAENQTQQHTNAYPLVIRFDDGKGNEKKKRLESGVYRVALAPDGAINLYAEGDVAPPVKIADVIPPDPTPKKFFSNPKQVTSRLFTNRFTPEVSRKQARKRSSIFGKKKS